VALDRLAGALSSVSKHFMGNGLRLKFCMEIAEKRARLAYRLPCGERRNVGLVPQSRGQA
jgi:hypothetical protein